MTNGNDPISPITDERLVSHYPKEGLTKREYFAAMALQGICTTFSGSKDAERQAQKAGKTLSELMALYANDVADALIDVLNGKNG